MLSRPRACWSAGVAGASVQPALAARAVAWTVQRPGGVSIGNRQRQQVTGGVDNRRFCRWHCRYFPHRTLGM
jgi:hypothetical protein